MTIESFIKKRPHLMWYVESPEKASKEAIVESVLNYGDFDDINKVISILGLKEVSGIFNKQIKRKRNNYNPKIINYFKMYFKKHA
jgi:hypothetical protein